MRAGNDTTRWWKGSVWVDDCFVQAHWRGEGALSWETLAEEPCPDLWPNKLLHPGAGNTAPFQYVLCPVVRAQSASDMPSKLSLFSIQTAPSYQSTGLGRLIWCQESDVLRFAQHGGRGHTLSFCGPILRATFTVHLGG